MLFWLNLFLDFYFYEVRMKIQRLGRDGLLDYILTQLDNFFPDGCRNHNKIYINRFLDEALFRLGVCINAVRAWEKGSFDYLHSTQYCTFLYFLANSIWRSSGDSEVSTRIFLLNKALNGIDLFYEIEMPSVFLIGHSSGIVLSKAVYGERVVIFQGVTIGKSHGTSPVIGDNVVFYPGSCVVGSCVIGEGAVVSQGVSVINENVPRGMIAFGRSRELIFKNNGFDEMMLFFRGGDD